MHEQRPEFFRFLGYDTGRVPVDLEAALVFRLGLVDSSVSSSIDNYIGRSLFNPIPNGVVARQINFGKIDTYHMPKWCHCAAQFVTDLPNLADDKDARRHEI